MNSYVYLTIMVILGTLVGFIISQDTIENQYHDYLYTKAEGYAELESDIATNLESVVHASDEYDPDKTTGDKLALSSNWLKALNYGLNPFSIPKPTNVYESFLLSVFTIYKALIVLYTGLLTFMLLYSKLTS